eukprot:gene58131-biopygen78908
MQRQLQSALQVSEYTDRVDVATNSWNDKREDRMGNHLIDLYQTMLGLSIVGQRRGHAAI